MIHQPIPEDEANCACFPAVSMSCRCACHIADGRRVQCVRLNDRLPSYPDMIGAVGTVTEVDEATADVAWDDFPAMTMFLSEIAPA
jgi:hypothetical protein